MTYLAKACWSEFMLKCLTAPKGVHALVTSEDWEVRWLGCRPESQIATRAPTAVSSRKDTHSTDTPQYSPWIVSDSSNNSSSNKLARADSNNRYTGPVQR